MSLSEYRPESLRRLAHLALSGSGWVARRLRSVCEIILRHHFNDRFSFSGSLKSPATLTGPFGTGWRKQLADIYFQHREKSEISLAAASSWYGGDYMEFGSHGLRTFKNMLSAFDLCGLAQKFPDTRFYAFDIFGKMQSDDLDTHNAMLEFDRNSDGYFSKQFPAGDEFEKHVALLRDHGIFIDKCHLVQGYFQETLHKGFKDAYRAEGRKIGFAFIDCNIESQYKIVFEFIYDLVGENSYLYMDEYPQSAGVIHYFEEFSLALRKKGIGTIQVRNAGGFGTLFRLYPLIALPRLELFSDLKTP